MSDKIELGVPSNLAPLGEFISVHDAEVSALATEIHSKTDQESNGAEAVYMGVGFTALLAATVLFAGRHGGTN